MEEQLQEDVREENEVTPEDLATDSIISGEGSAEDKRDDSPKQRRKRKGIPSKVSVKTQN